MDRSKSFDPSSQGKHGRDSEPMSEDQLDAIAGTMRANAKLFAYIDIYLKNDPKIRVRIKDAAHDAITASQYSGWHEGYQAGSKVTRALMEYGGE